VGAAEMTEQMPPGREDLVDVFYIVCQATRQFGHPHRTGRATLLELAVELTGCAQRRRNVSCR